MSNRTPTVAAPDRRSTPLQGRLAIELAPDLVREHGLRETHKFPLVSHGKRHGPINWSARKPIDVAFAEYDSLEFHRSASAVTAVVLDVDGLHAVDRVLQAVYYDFDGIAEPNWWTMRPASGGAHVVWTLAKPVLRGEHARERPLRKLAVITEYLAERLDADQGYAGILAHNPTPPDGAGLRTEWRRRDPYSLDELAESIPEGWRRPTVSRTGIGRNVDVFTSCIKWAGSPKNAGEAVLPYALVVNEQMKPPLDFREVKGIAASVGRIRAAGFPKSRRRPPGSGIYYTHTSEEQAERARRGGEKRRAAVADRDAAMLAMHRAGVSYAAIGQHFEVGKTTAYMGVQRAAAADASPTLPGF